VAFKGGVTQLAVITNSVADELAIRASLARLRETLDTDHHAMQGYDKIRMSNVHTSCQRK